MKNSLIFGIVIFAAPIIINTTLAETVPSSVEFKLSSSCPLTKSSATLEGLTQSRNALNAELGDKCKEDAENITKITTAVSNKSTGTWDILKAVQHGDVVTTTQISDLTSFLNGLTTNLNKLVDGWSNKCNDTSVLDNLGQTLQSLSGIASFVNSNFSLPFALTAAFTGSILRAFDKIFTKTKDKYGFNGKDEKANLTNQEKYLNQICAFAEVNDRYFKFSSMVNTNSDYCVIIQESIKSSKPYRCYSGLLSFGEEQATTLANITAEIEKIIADTNGTNPKDKCRMIKNLIKNGSTEENVATAKGIGTSPLSNINNFYEKFISYIDPDDRKNAESSLKNSFDSISQPLSSKDGNGNNKPFGINCFNVSKDDLENKIVVPIKTAITNYQDTANTILNAAKPGYIKKNINDPNQNISLEDFKKYLINDFNEQQKKLQEVGTDINIINIIDLLNRIAPDWEKQLAQDDLTHFGRLEKINKIIQNHLLATQDVLDEIQASTEAATFTWKKLKVPQNDLYKKMIQDRGIAYLESNTYTPIPDKEIEKVEEYYKKLNEQAEEPPENEKISTTKDGQEKKLDLKLIKDDIEYLKELRTKPKDHIKSLGKYVDQLTNFNISLQFCSYLLENYLFDLNPQSSSKLNQKCEKVMSDYGNVCRYINAFPLPTDPMPCDTNEHIRGQKQYDSPCSLSPVLN